MLKFVIYGEPHAQERSGNRITSRFDPIKRRTKQFVHHFDQPKSAAFKEQVRQLAAIEILKNRDAMFPVKDKEIILHVVAFRTIPKSWSNKKKSKAAAGNLRPTTKPDLKNYIWGVEDALNKIVWHDDGQVVSFGNSGKWFTDGLPRIEITVEFVG